MNKDIEKFWEQLKTQRDELRVRAHLARAELTEELDVIEIKWQEAEKKFEHFQDEAIETTTEMKKSLHIILDEISGTFERIKHRLDD
jgi:hypothetical protein